MLVAVSEVAAKLHLLTTDGECDKLLSEYVEFLLEEPQTISTEHIPQFWCKSGEIYPTLTKFIKALMTFPHSNASSERVFSMLKKIHTEQRSNLCKDTLNHLLAFKINNPNCCFDQTFDVTEVRKLKKATQQYNDTHSSGSTKGDSSKAILVE